MWKQQQLWQPFKSAADPIHHFSGRFALLRRQDQMIAIQQGLSY